MQNFLTIDADRFGWRSLRVFNLYRLFVAITLIGLIGAGISPKGDPGTDPLLFLVTSIGYLLIGSIAFLTGRLHYPPFGLQVFSLVFLDVVCILLITHAGGGLDSGFGMLLIPVIAGAGLLVPGQLAVLFAALASLALLGQQALTSLAGGEFGTYTQTGLLGATLFITAVIAMVLARRAQESAELAARRGVDLANLTALNEHIIERMQSGVLVVDDTGNIRLINEAAWRLLGNPGHSPRAPPVRA